jgi:pimeloyl-ACP methyl ester carboxylesterase
MDRSSSFAKLQRRLEGCTVVRYDRRGYGRSIDLGPPVSFQQQVDDLIDVLDDRRGVLVGHSLGGVIALATAEQRPDLVSAVLAYESPMPWTTWWPSESAGSVVSDEGDPGDKAEAFMQRMIGVERWQRLPPSTRADRRAEGAALVAELRSVRDPDNPPYDPAGVTVPVLAVHGTTSKPHHTRTAEALAGLVPGASLAVIEGAGHGAHASHSDDLAALVRRLLA